MKVRVFLVLSFVFSGMVFAEEGMGEGKPQMTQRNADGGGEGITKLSAEGEERRAGILPVAGGEEMQKVEGRMQKGEEEEMQKGEERDKGGWDARFLGIAGAAAVGVLLAGVGLFFALRRIFSRNAAGSVGQNGNRFRGVVALFSMDQGARQEQQDAVGIAGKGSCLLAVLCDGAGGHQGGRQASQAAVRTAGEALERAGGKFADPASALQQICGDAHKAICGMGENPKRSPRSTMVLLYLGGGMAHWAHIGDSRLYRLQGGEIRERTKDHSMVEVLFQQGEVAEEEMGTHPDQGRLLRALGGEEEPRVSLGSAVFGAGDAFLLCSDGFWERTKRKEIEGLFAGGITQKRLDAAVRTAVERNGPKGDNVSAFAVFSTGNF